MARKSLFLLAATIVIFYFTVILLILKPLHGAKNVYATYHMGYRGFSLFWCKELKFRSSPLPFPIALASYPGSGNTWLRYLLQQSTGILTGSIYLDYGLRLNGFPAENVSDGSVLVVKTHDLPSTYMKYAAAILLIRNPRDAILAEFHRLHRGHIGTASKAAFRNSRDSKRSDWTAYVYSNLPKWVQLNERWLTNFTGPLHVVIYEQLVRDTKNTLENVLKFLNETVSEEQWNCAIRNKEGIYRRKNKHKNFDPFNPNMYRTLEVAKSKIAVLLENHRKKEQNNTVS